MGTLRPRGFMRCFYCGKKSNIRFDGQRSFDCLTCDATNWLDEDGEITDPPINVSMTERDRVQFAIPRSASVRSPSPPSQPVDDPVFCGTCLRNQHMLASSLAQFEWPDNPSSAEYAARERKYYNLRKDLESRYPQMCPECEPKVEQKIAEASYTAQTDHLRRMMDRTRSHRRDTKKKGVLDTVDTAGKWCWYLAFTLQAMWHALILSALLAEQLASVDSNAWMTAVLGRLHRIVLIGRATDIDRLMRWAVTLGMFSFPWNPRFKQTIRGFTAHILGFRKWYTYQLLLSFVRFVCLSIAQYSRSQGLPATTHLGAQIVLAILVPYLFRVAKTSIHTDTTPLFRQRPKVTGLLKSPPRTTAPKDPNDLGSALDEILDTPSSMRFQNESPTPSPTYQPVAPLMNHTPRATSPRSSFGSLHISDPAPGWSTQPKVTHYGDEMDWSPSASQHRAFSSYNPYKIKNTNPRFSDTPIEPKAGPIWYKVPPAPTNPAQRLRNPPMRPIIRESPKDTNENFFRASGRGPVDFRLRNETIRGGIELAQPRFHAPGPKDDPRDSLSNMFASSFSISPDPEERETRNTGPSPFGISGLYSEKRSEFSHNQIKTRVMELVVLLAALWGWIFALGTEERYGPTAALASVCICLIVSVRLAADLEVEAQIKGGQRPSVFTASWANLALAQVIATLFLMWNIWSGSATEFHGGGYGNLLFGGIIGHHMWHIFA